jgi:hypothetical protein
MNYLVHIPSGLPSPELEILLAKSQEIIDKKNILHIVVCSGLNNYSCSLNPYSLRLVCFGCKNRLKNGLKKLSGNFNLIETPKISDQTTKYLNLKKNSLNFYRKVYLSYQMQTL